MAIDAMVGRRVLDWRQREITLSRARIYRQLARLQEEGLAGLGRRRRSDDRQARVIISRAWDRAVPFDDATKEKIAEHLREDIRSLRARKTTRHLVLLLSGEWLKKETVGYGYRPADPAELDAICKVPLAFYTTEAKYEAVYEYTRHRDRFDNKLPRVKRSIAGMRPMEMVVCDVHPIDVRVRRSDGVVGSIDLLGFMDIATRRVWCELLFVEGQGGVRNTDVIQAFLAMAQDPAWGLPEQLYCDNGKEYLFADYLEDALALNARNALSNGRERRIIRALPYNAAAKPIEGWFGRFEADYLRTVKGWHGGKLGSPERPARGKLPAPFEGGFEGFCEAFYGLLKAYEHVPQSGSLKGDSPKTRFQRFISDGWAATIMDPAEVLTVFAKTETRTVRKHGISVDGRSWNCPELDAYFDRVVTVKIPVLGIGFNELWIGDERGDFVGIARPDIEKRYDDTRHALHSAERKRVTTAEVRKLKSDTRSTDVAGRLRGLADESAAFQPNDPGGVVSVAFGGSTEDRAIMPGRRRRRGGDDEEAMREANRRQLAANEEIERLHREALARAGQ